MGYPLAKVEQAVDSLKKRFPEPDTCVSWGPEVEPQSRGCLMIVSILESTQNPQLEGMKGPGALGHDVKVIVAGLANTVTEKELYEDYVEGIIEEMQALGFKFKRSGYTHDQESGIAFNEMAVDFTIVA